MKAPTKLIHEVWEDRDEDGQWMPGICLAGPHGAKFRASLTNEARRIATISAVSHFEAMTKYNRLLGREPYKTRHEWDRRPYPAEWAMTQKLKKQ